MKKLQITSSANVLFCLFITLTILFALSCKDSDITSPTEVKWEYGESKTYNISSNTQIIISDSISGCSFKFPKGGNGTLTIKKILTGPEVEYGNATRFSLEYSGSDTIQIVLTHKVGDYDLAFYYGSKGGVAIDGTKNPTWWGLEEFIEEKGNIVYNLKFKNKSPNIINSKKSDRLLNNEIIKHFAVSNVPAGSSDNISMKAVEKTVQQCIDKWLENLPSDLETSANSQIKGKLKWCISWSSGNAYSHGNSSIFSNATFSFKKTAQLNGISHEVGHYMTHVLCGYERYNEIVNRMPSMILWGLEEHQPFSYRPGRRDQLEEPAMLSEYMCMGSFPGCNFELDMPNDVLPLSNLKPNFPKDIDYPSHEIFGVYVLMAVKRTTNKIYPFDYTLDDYKKKLSASKVPVVGASWEDILRIVSKGSRDINELIINVQNYLDDLGNDHRFKLPAMLEPIGWSYNGSGKIIDQNGSPVQNAHVQNIVQDGKDVYRTWMSAYSGKDGSFVLPRLYPGNSILRVFFNGDKDSSDFPCNIPYTKVTNETIILDDLIVEIKELKIKPENFTGEALVEYTWQADYPEIPTNAKYVWNFGDEKGPTTILNSKEVKHIFSKPGKYTINLKLYNNSDNKLVAETNTIANMNAGSNLITTPINYSVGYINWSPQNISIKSFLFDIRGDVKYNPISNFKIDSSTKHNPNFKLYMKSKDQTASYYLILAIKCPNNKFTIYDKMGTDYPDSIQYEITAIDWKLTDNFAASPITVSKSTVLGVDTVKINFNTNNGFISQSAIVRSLLFEPILKCKTIKYYSSPFKSLIGTEEYITGINCSIEFWKDY